MKFIYRVLPLLISQLIALVACTAQTVPGRALVEANQLYEAGNHADAVHAYEALVASGIEDPVLYYNLGNAHLRLDAVGKAIASYRHAQRLAPRDQEIAANLAIARGRTQDLIVPATVIENRAAEDGLLANGVAPFLSDRFMPRRWLSARESALVALGLWFLLGLLVAALRLFPAFRRPLTYGVGLTVPLLILSLLPLATHINALRQPAAVLIAPEIQINSGPGNDYLTVFTLHDGAEVTVLEERATWLRIALPGDLQGWAPKADFAIIE